MGRGAGLCGERAQGARPRGRGLRVGQMLQRGGLPVPEVHPAGLWPQQPRSLHPAVPRFLRHCPDREHRLRRRHRHLQRDRERRRRHHHRCQPGREPPRRRDLFQAVRQARRQAHRDGPARCRPASACVAHAPVPPRLRRRAAQLHHARHCRRGADRPAVYRGDDRELGRRARTPRGLRARKDGGADRHPGRRRP